MRGFVKKAGYCLIAAILSLGGYLIWLQLTGNFHEVVPGQLYRSAQLGPDQLGSYIRQYGIKTVVNLRGEAVSADWYTREVAATRRNGAQHVDFRMSASRQLTGEQSLALMKLLRDMPKPVLIHCKSGADRTGLAAVIFLQQIAGVDEEVAEWQLSPIYGHLNLPFLGAYAMDDTWEALEKVLGLPS